MKTQDIIKGIKNEWAVVAPWQWKSRKNTPTNYSAGLKAKIVDGHKYKRTDHTSTDSSVFTRVSQSEKSFGMLVTFEYNGETRFAVIKPQDFLQKWDEYFAYWEQENARLAVVRAENEARMKIEQEKRQRRDDIEVARREQMQVEAERLKVSIRESLSSLVGSVTSSTVYIDPTVRGEWKNLDTPNEQYVVTKVGDVRLDLRLFERLLEMALDGKEN